MPAIFGTESTTLGLLRSLAERGDKTAEAIVAIMNGTNWLDMSAAAEAGDVIRVTGTVKDQDGQVVSAVKGTVVKCFPPLKAFLTDVTYATAAALPACTPAGTGVGHTLTANANAALSIDGVAVANTQRVLIKNQAAADDNGVYTVTDLGSGGAPFILTRATDFDAVGEFVHGAQVRVRQGLTNAGKTFVHTTSGVIVVDTTNIVFTDLDGGTIGGLTIGTKGTLTSGIASREAWIATDSSGVLEVDVASVMVGSHLIKAITDNGEVELVVVTFA